MRLVEHRDRLADAGRGTEVDPQRASTHVADPLRSPGARRREAREGEVELEDVDARLAEEPADRGPGCAPPTSARTRATSRPRAAATRATCAAAYAGEMCGSSPLADAVSASAGDGGRVEPGGRRPLGDLGAERASPEVRAPARVAGVAAGRGAARRTTGSPCPLLPDEGRADDRAVDADERAGGLVTGGDLPDAPDGGGVEQAEQDGEDEHGAKARRGLLDEGVQVWSRGSHHSGEVAHDEVDQLDPDERGDDAAHAVDEDVAPQEGRAAERAIANPPQRQAGSAR